MTTDTVTENKKSTVSGIPLFGLLVFSGVIAAFVICSGLFNFSDETKKMLIQVYIVAIAIGWFAYSAR